MKRRALLLCIGFGLTVAGAVFLCTWNRIYNFVLKEVRLEINRQVKIRKYLKLNAGFVLMLFKSLGNLICSQIYVIYKQLYLLFKMGYP